MAKTTSTVPQGSSKHLPRFTTCSVILLQSIFFTSILSTTANKVNHSKTLDDVTVHEGNTARFLCYCYTSHVPTSTQSRDADKITVAWTFEGLPLHLDLDLDDQRVRVANFEDRQVLMIGHVRRTDAGRYACTVTSSEGQEETFQGTLFVQSVPDPPTDVEVTSCHGNAAEISWQPGNNNGAEIVMFAIQFNISDKPDSWFDFYEDVPGDKNQAFVELSPYGTYSFRVLAENEVGMSRPSNVTSRECTTPPDRPDRNPRFVWTETDQKGYLVVEWEPLHRLSFHGPGFHYTVLWRLKGSLAWKSAKVNGSYTTKFKHEVDQVYSTYEFRVKAANDMGEAHQPAFIFFGKSYETEPEIRVSELRVDPKKEITRDTVHFIWEAVDPLNPKIRGKFRGYKIMYWRWYSGQEKGHKKVSVMVPGHGLTPGQEIKATVSDLPAHSTIRFQVVVVNSHYQGPPSDVIDVFTPEGVPSAVRELFADAVTSHSIVLMWLPPDETNGILTGFDIGIQHVQGNKLSKLKVLNGNDPYQLRRRISGLKGNTRYRIHLVAKTKVGPGDLSFIDVQTAIKKSGRKKTRHNKNSEKTSGGIPSASRKESSYNTDRMQPVDDDNSACQSCASSHTFIFIIVSCAYHFLTVSSIGNWS